MPVSDRRYRRPHPALLEVSKQLRPRLLRLPVAVLDSYELLGAVEPRPHHDQAAQPIVLAQPHLGVYHVRPHIDVIHPREIAFLEHLVLRSPLLGQTGYSSRALKPEDADSNPLAK